MLCRLQQIWFINRSTDRRIERLFEWNGMVSRIMCCFFRLLLCILIIIIIFIFIIIFIIIIVRLFFNFFEDRLYAQVSFLLNITHKHRIEHPHCIENHCSLYPTRPLIHFILKYHIVDYFIFGFCFDLLLYYPIQFYCIVTFDFLLLYERSIL